MRVHAIAFTYRGAAYYYYDTLIISFFHRNTSSLMPLFRVFSFPHGHTPCRARAPHCHYLGTGLDARVRASFQGHAEFALSLLPLYWPFRYQ